jgi:signal transduction histidine kinase
MKILNLISAGTSGVKEQETISRIKLVNTISLAVSVSILIIGSAICIYMNWALNVAIPLAVEFIFNGSVLILNYYKRYIAASSLLYFLQCTAITYFGFMLIRIFHLEFVIILLIAITYLIFKEKVLRRLALAGALLVLVLLETYYYRVDAHPILIENYDQIFVMRVLLVLSIISITILVSRPYVTGNDMKYELQRANQLIKIFVAQITHEIRSPLDNIHHVTQLLRKEVEKDENLNKIKPLVDVGFTVSSNAKNIVNNVLDLAEIEAGKSPVILNEAFKVAPFFDKMLEVHKIIARREDMKVILQIDPKIPEVIFGDPLNINQVLTNLLTNAFKYGQKGKTVKVDVRRREQYWELRVSNYGPIIPAAKVDSIFDPFTTGKTGHIQGSGLGLYIVKTKADLMGGLITMESNDSYTSFTLSLPLREGKLRDLPEGAGSDPDTGNLYKVHVMVAEDDKLTRFLYSRFLTDMGCSFTIVKNGRELLEAARKKCPDDCPDIFILDCHMPELDGEQTTLEIKRNPALAHIPIIVTTGDVYSDTLERMLRAGVNTYLKKPIDHVALLKTIHLHLNRLPQN